MVQDARPIVAATGKVMARSWKGGTWPEKVVSRARTDQRPTETRPIEVAARRDGMTMTDRGIAVAMPDLKRQSQHRRVLFRVPGQPRSAMDRGGNGGRRLRDDHGRGTIDAGRDGE